MELQKRVCFMSVCHAPFDDRIYKKEALTLAKNGFEVYHICYGDSEQRLVTKDNIHIVQLQKKRKGKSFKTVFAALKQSKLQDLFDAAKEVNADVYHLHDVELCRIALKLKTLPQRPKVIYDAHEPFLDNLIDYWHKRSIPKLLLNDIPSIMAEKRILSKVDFLIATEENVAKRFEKNNKNSDIIYNYSYYVLEKQNEEPDKNYDMVYCGLIAKAKGIFLILNALIELKKMGFNYKFLAVGNFDSQKTEQQVRKIVKKNNLEKQVEFVGQVNFEDVGKYYQMSKIGLCLFPKNRSNQLILPIKIFEYAAFGLPIIGSNFGHVEQIIKNNNIGTCVPPMNAKEVAAAMVDIISEEKYKSYISRCVDCVKMKYLWENQEKKLLQIYEQLGSEKE